MTSSTTSTDTDDIDLLDLLVVAADNLHLLIIAPVMASLLGLAAAFMLTPTYESKSILALPSNTTISSDVIASYLRSSDVLTQAGMDAQIAPGLSKAKLLKKMDELVSVAVGKQDRLITLTAQGATPEAAQHLNQVLWTLALPMAMPQGTDRTRLENQLHIEKERLAASTALEVSTAKLLSSGTHTESTSRLYGDLLASNSQRLQRIAALEAQLEGPTLNHLTQQATLPEEPIKPKKSLITIAAGLGGGILALLFVFVRQAFRGASNNPKQAAKVQQIRRAFHLKP